MIFKFLKLNKKRQKPKFLDQVQENKRLNTIVTE